jgi:hypothetical protein
MAAAPHLVAGAQVQARLLLSLLDRRLAHAAAAACVAADEVDDGAHRQA